MFGKRSRSSENFFNNFTEDLLLLRDQRYTGETQFYGFVFVCRRRLIWVMGAPLLQIFFCLAISSRIFCICHYLNFYSFAGFTKKLNFCNIFSCPLVVVSIDPVSEMAGLNLQKEKQVCFISCTSVDLFIFHLKDFIRI